jgi:hypothetical protein
MDIENLAKELILKNMTPEQQMAVLDSVRQSVANAKEVQKKKIGENVDLVVQALKKIEADIRDRFDAVGNSIEKRVLSIQDGRDGANGTDGRNGKDGKSGRDGLKGDRGVDGQAGRDGVDGVDGISVVNAHIDFDGSLVIALSDGRELNVGEVVSQDIAEKIKVISTMSTNAAIAIKDEGTSITSAVKNINFVGATVTATNSGDDVTVNVSAGTGTVTSVGLSGGTTGLTTTGSPITTTGTITLGGTLAVANGGTGTATPSLVAGTNITSITGTWPNQTINASGGAGTVTSVAATVPAFLSVAGSPITTTGTLAISLSGTALPVANGGTGQTSYTDGQLLIGNTTGNTLTKTTLTAGSGISITNGGGSISIAATGSGTVTSVTATSPVVSSGGTTPDISLAANYGDTLNPYASKTAKFVLAAPNAASGVPTFRALVASDIPTLNQSTTGSAATLTTPRAIYGNNFDGSAALTQIIASTYGGTGNGFTKFSGATTAERTYTLPDASSTIVVQGGALGTPSSGTVTNLTGTASININGTVGATTANTGAFTTLSATGVTTVQAGTAALPAITTTGDTNTGIFFPAADTIAFSKGGAEAMRIDSSGNLLVGTTSLYGGEKLSVLQSTNNRGIVHQQTNASNTSSAFVIDCSRNTTNGTYNAIQYFNSGAGANKFLVLDSGNVQNTNNSYGALSDIKLKENITDASPKLEKLTQVRIVNYNLIGDTNKQLGVIAQELEQIFPRMVETIADRDVEGNDLGTTTKSVKYSVFVPMLIKAFQEQQALITALTARITALEAK